MIAFLDHQPPPAANKRPRPNLLLHCGARAVERREVQRVPTPRATDTWTPIPHLELVTQVEHNHAIGIEFKERTVNLLWKADGEQPWKRTPITTDKLTGPDITTYLNRHYLAKALRFGLIKLDLIDSMSPVRFSAGGRQMIVMPVRGDTPPMKTTTPPVSPPAANHQEPAAPNPPPTAERPKEEPMPDTKPAGATKRPEPTAPETTEKPALELALAQAEVVRGDFRNALVGLNKLGDLLKQVQRENKASDKEISSVRQRLRSLQSVRL